MQGPVVLPEDVQIVPLSDLPVSLRAQLEGEDGDFALTRPNSRIPSKVIDSNAAALLAHFRGPKTIVDAILAYSREVKSRPSEILEDAFPLIQSCILARLLVEPGSDAEKIEPCFQAGERIADNVVERPIQALIDSEVYQVRTPAGRLAALKIARPNAIAVMQKPLREEADLLRRVGGGPAPELLEMSELPDGRAFLAVDWFEGNDAQAAVHAINEREGEGAGQRTAEMCAGIIDAYAALHERRILHGDVHPRNVLVSASGEVRLIDFGLGRSTEALPERSPRAGVPFFFEPEYARAVHSGAHHLAPSLLGEQYGVAALVYSLLCGQHYLDFSLDKHELFRQIEEEEPLRFAARGASRFESLEHVVLRALDKQPARRFPTTREFAGAFRRALTGLHPPSGISIAHQHEAESLVKRVSAILADPQSELDHTGPASPSASVTYGSAGIAYAAYRLACAREDGRLLALADAWAERAAMDKGDQAFYSAEIQITEDTVGKVSPFHSASGIAMVQALVSNARSDTFHLGAAVDRYLDITSVACPNPDLTLGRASVLHGLTLLLGAIAPDKPQALVDRGNELCTSLLDLMESEPAIGEGGTTSYLGLAHGWAGLLYAILRWAQLLDRLPAPIVEERLSQLAGCAQLTRHGARWPVQAGAGSLSMAGWCNGSAGHAHLWALAHRIYREQSHLELAERSAMDAFEGSGGGHALCCGFAGQAYSQLDLYKLTGKRQWLDQARSLCNKACAIGNAMLGRHRDSLPHSLYKGDMGVAVLAAEIEKPGLASMPFFEPEP